MKLLGVLFALILLFLPLSMNLKAITEVKEATSTADVSDVLEEKETKGFFSSFVRRFKARMEKTESLEIRTEYSEAKSRMENLQKKVEGILKKLNNTES